MKNICTFVILYVLSCVDGKTVRRYKFGIDCSVTLEYIDEDLVVYAEYDGTSEIRSWCDDMSFVGRDENYENEYKICVTPERYEDPNCAIEMQYTSTFGGYVLKSYTCNDKPTERYCGEQDEYFYIDLKTLKSDDNVRQARIELKIEAVMTYDHGQMVGIVLGAIFGGIVLISIVGGIVIFFACRRKRSPGQVMTPAPTSSIPMQQTNFASGNIPTQPTAPPQTNYPNYYQPPPQYGNIQSDQRPTGFTSNGQPPQQYDNIQSDQQPTGFTNSGQPPQQYDNKQSDQQPTGFTYNGQPPSYADASKM